MAATVIDALVVTLGLDRKDWKKGRAETKKELDETKKQVNETSQAFATLTKQAATFIALFTAGRGIKDFIEDITASNTSLERLSANLKTNSGDLSLWGRVAAYSGGTADGFQSSIQNLSRSLTEIAVTGSSAVLPYYRALGVHLADNTGKARSYNDILLELSGKVSSMDRQTGNNLLSMMGFDQGTANALLDGPDAIKRIMDRLQQMNPVNQQQTRQSKELSNAWFNLSQTAEGVGRSIVGFLTPALTWLINVVTRSILFLERHKALLIGIAAVITAYMLPSLIAMAGALWDIVAPLLLMAAPILLAAAAVALLADDWWTWLNGGKSALGGLWDTFAAVIHKIENAGPLVVAAIANAFKGARDAAMDMIFNVKSNASGLAGAASAGIGALATLDSAKIADAAKNGFAEGASGGRQDEAMDFFMRNGWAREQAAGIVANLKAESNFDPSVKGDNGQAVGLGQWHADRQLAYKQWSGKNLADASFLEQLGFVQHELTTGSEQSAGRAIRGANSAGAAGAIASLSYERPADKLGQATARAASAKLIASGYSGSRAAVTAPRTDYVTKNAGDVSTSSNETHIGSITINTQATDAKGIAMHLPSELNRHLVYQSNTGVN